MHVFANFRRPSSKQHRQDAASPMSDVHRGIGVYLRLYGSVIPRVMPFAVLGSAEGVFLKWASNNLEHFEIFKYWQQGGSWYHPYAFHVFGMLLGFALVMRIQIAYQRYWEGTTQCHQAASKWADAVMQVMAFDEASADAFSDEGLEFRMLVLHCASQPIERVRRAQGWQSNPAHRGSAPSLYFR